MALSQPIKPINYLIPDTVKSMIATYLDRNPSKHIVAFLQYVNDTTTIEICNYDTSSKKQIYLVSNTNRFIEINSKLTIPVVLQSDIALSELLHQINNKAAIEKTMSVTDIRASGYLIIYRGLYWNITIVKAGYYQD